jgi:hypothetical protein
MAAANEHGKLVPFAEIPAEDSWYDSSEDEDDESGSDMEFGEFDLIGARKLLDQQTVAGYEDDDEDEDECGAQFSVRPFRGGALAQEMGNLQLSGFATRSDGPEITDQHELTSYDMRHLVHLALEGGGNMEDDEAYQRWPAARPCLVSRAPPWSGRRCSPRTSTNSSGPSRQARSFRILMRTGF